jgi:DME family drug/metabolite transporter
MPPRLAIATGALIFSTGGAAIKYADFAAWQVASFRSGIAALTLLLVLKGVHRSFTWRALLVGCAYAVTLIAFVLANRMTTGANAIYLQSTAPLFLLLLGPVLLSERLQRRDFPVMLAVAMGLVLVMWGSSAPSATAPDPVRGNLIALLSGLSYALMLCGLRWLGRSGASNNESLAAIVLGNLVAFLVALPMALPLGSHPPTDWLLIGYLGCVQIAVAYLLVTYGLKKVRALDASLLLMIETALNPVWTWLLMGEVPTMLAVMGGVVIVGSTIVHTAVAARSATPAEAT